MGKLLRNTGIMFVLAFVLTYLWHAVIFVSQYNAHLIGIANLSGGVPTPRFAWFALGHILVGAAFAMLLPKISKSTGEFVTNGAMTGLITFGFFAITSHALFANWGGWLMSMDICFGLIAGAILGWVMSKLA